MNEKIKALIKKKNAFYRSQRKSINFDCTTLDAMILEVSNAIIISKTKHYERLVIKLNDSQTASKSYWSILKTFVNGIKIPLIPPLLENVKLKLTLN